MNLTHQGGIIFATWFTFDHDHTPLWLVVQMTLTTPGVYSGAQVYRLSGPAFSAVPFPAIGFAWRSGRRRRGQRDAQFC